MYQQVRILLLSLLLWLPIALAQEPSRKGTNRPQYCSVATCGAASNAATCNRRLNPRLFDAPNLTSLPKKGRWITPENYDGTLDSFFRGEVARVVHLANGGVKILGEDVTSKFTLLKDSPTSMAMLGFCGCVGLVVMSKSAVYMAHIVEDPILRYPERFRPGLQLLGEGTGADNHVFGLEDLASTSFAPDQEPLVVVFAPKTGNKFQYQDQMVQLGKWVKQCKFTPRACCCCNILTYLLVVVIGVDPKWIGYSPIRRGDEKQRFDWGCARAEGKLLMQYQPSIKGLFGFRRSNAQARLWIEGKATPFEKSWEPSAVQHFTN
ncbi:hypothetical protein CDEST_12954 [Colletotrichum destructivum]|uniref:Uncharacterized protein n=1 Tax=Colletotrichum destructivum TaxID=34406 RepID=A0AAX4IXF7_9PEZI|nr:hypothetical protein CDEST_12954 [Colletotrichum destructivum]